MSYIGPITRSLEPVINYISNGNAADGVLGWSAYAESDAVTFQDTGDTVTLNNHGLSNNAEVAFTSITSTTGISINTRYYVVNATTNTFQVSSSSGGSALPLTTNGSGTLVRFIPKLGAGGSPSVTFTRNTSSPLRQSADFRFVKDAANRMGQGVSYDFTIDDADLAKVLTISFDYELITATGTYADADVTVYLIQDPTGTPVVIQPAGYTVLSAASGLPVKQIATFQASSSIKSYRLCVHVASVSATAYTLAIDNVSVDPQVIQYGAPVTDWQDFPSVAAGTLITATTTNPTYGTVAVNKAQWRRVGSDMEIRWDFRQTTAGTAGSGIYLFNLPTGYSLDLSRVTINASSDDSKSLGVFDYLDAASAIGSGYVTAHSSTQLRMVMQVQNSSAQISQGTVSSSFGSLSTATASYGIKAKVPIQGWSSTVQMSNDTDTRVVAALYNRASGTQSITANVTDISFPTLTQDTHGAWNGSQFTAPVPGFYCFDGSVQLSAQIATNLSLYVNGTRIKTGNNNRTTDDVKHFSGVIYMTAGQSASLRSDTAVTISVTSDVYHHISIYRLSGPSAIAASETVAARYFTSAGPAVNNTTPVITYGTKVFDTHGAMSGNTYTIPISGKYWIQMHAYTSSYAATAASFCEGIINKNGNFHSFLFSKRIDAAVTAPQGGGGSCIVDCLAGDTIQFRVGTGVATTLSTTQTDTGNFIGIYRIGN